MSRAVSAALDLAPHGISAWSRIGAHPGPEFCLELPAPHADAPIAWGSEESDALVLEALAIMHLPVIDTLMIGLPADWTHADGEFLKRKYTGRHVVRNSECRSQTLSVTIRHVLLAHEPAQAFLPGP